MENTVSQNSLCSEGSRLLKNVNTSLAKVPAKKKSEITTDGVGRVLANHLKKCKECKNGKAK
ncbi:MAG: hypothetical protein FWE16_03125 [Firmicutes bacterium]|nr:hypothetical protein [Bacillota bacterium]